MEINLSALLEAALKAKLAASANDKWKKKNTMAIKAYNTNVEKEGCFGDSERDF